LRPARPCSQRGHVEGGPDRRPASGDCLAASQRAAVAIDGRNADEACDLAPIEAPELRQFGDQGAQSGFAHSGQAGQKVGVGLPGGALPDRPVDVAIELRKLGLQDIDMPVDSFQHARLTSESTTVFLRHDHLDDLPPARHQFAQRLGLSVRDRPRRRANGRGEVSDRASKDARLFDGLWRRGVEAVGLGELAGRTGEVADLTRG
jgi:hypothetical protein